MAQNIEKTTSNQTSVQSGQYDTVSKDLIHQNPEDWIKFGLGIPEVRVIQVIDTEQPTVRSNRADSFIQAEVNGRESIVHFEIQTRDSTGIPMPRRIAGYAGRCIESFGLPIYSHVIYLHPDAGRNDLGQYLQEIQDYTIVVKYKVIRLFQVPKPEGMGLFNPLPDLMFFGLDS